MSAVGWRIEAERRSGPAWREPDVRPDVFLEQIMGNGVEAAAGCGEGRGDDGLLDITSADSVDGSKTIQRDLRYRKLGREMSLPDAPACFLVGECELDVPEAGLDGGIIAIRQVRGR